MKTALIFFRAPERKFVGEYYSEVVETLNVGGFAVDTVEVLSDTDDLGFKRRFTEFKDTVDNLIIIGGDGVAFNLKEIIAESMDSALVENENAKSFLDAVSKNEGVDYPESYAYLPIESTVIPNVRGGYQGFILDGNEFTLAVLPKEYKEIKTMCDKYVLPYLENKFGIKRKRLVLKYFGDKSLLERTLIEAENIGMDGFSFVLTENNGDVTADILFNDSTDGAVRDEVIRYVLSAHKENVYAEFDTTLGERLFDLLKLRGLKLSVAESFTGGRVVSEMIKNSGASAYVHEGVVSYSNQSKMDRLGVKEQDLKKHGAVSSVVAYMMAAGLLQNADTDLAIATTGIAGPKSDDTEKPVGLCYIAVGMRDGVHTYRYKLSGTREQITETAKNTALFLAIKKLKNI